MRLLIRALRNPRPYLIKLGYFLAGTYFDLVLKEYATDGCRFRVPPNLTRRADRGYFALGNYESAERELLPEIPEDATVLELGGCIGVVSCLTNRRLSSPRHHVVVEANPDMIPWLLENRERNGCGFFLENAVLSEQPSVTFYKGPSMLTGSLHDAGSESITCPGITLGGLEQKHGLRFNAIVMDIEGAEWSVITENRQAFSRIDTLILENHPHITGPEKMRDYEEILHEAGLVNTRSVGSVSLWKRPVATRS